MFHLHYFQEVLSFYFAKVTNIHYHYKINKISRLKCL
jgi:hypothetical protein